MLSRSTIVGPRESFCYVAGVLDPIRAIANGVRHEGRNLHARELRVVRGADPGSRASEQRSLITLAASPVVGELAREVGGALTRTRRHVLRPQLCHQLTQHPDRVVDPIRAEITVAGIAGTSAKSVSRCGSTASTVEPGNRLDPHPLRSDRPTYPRRSPRGSQRATVCVPSH